MNDLNLFEIEPEPQEAPGGGGPRFLATTSLAWLTRAARRPGRSLHLAIALKLQWDLAHRSEFAMQTAMSEAFGIDRYAERRALVHLRDAGLITLKSRRGARPRVALIGAHVPDSRPPRSAVT